jgi:regulator of protease activity HflC (stomatin/prohibitin superfamily)
MEASVAYALGTTLALGIAVFIFLIVVIIKSTIMVNQAEVVIIERLGKFHSILKPGIHFIIPFCDHPRSSIWTFVKEDPYSGKLYRFSKAVERIDLRESVYDFPRQNVITKDNVTMEINALLYYQITDPHKAVYEIRNLPESIEKLTQTKLREVIGSLDLDESLVSRDLVNEKLRETLDIATDKWGVKVNRVELQEITPPKDIKVAMEKQMRAERDRRAIIIEAEGEKRARILEAEGEKISKIEKATGEAEARKIVADGEAEALKIIAEAIPGKDPVSFVIATNYIKTLPEITKGKDNKMIILPYEISGVMGSVASIKEIFHNGVGKDLPKTKS